MYKEEINKPMHGFDKDNNKKKHKLYLQIGPRSRERF